MYSNKLLNKKNSKFQYDNKKQLKVIETIKDENKILKNKVKKLESQVDKSSYIIKEQEELLESERSVSDKL